MNILYLLIFNCYSIILSPFFILQERVSSCHIVYVPATSLNFFINTHIFMKPGMYIIQFNTTTPPSNILWEFFLGGGALLDILTLEDKTAISHNTMNQLPSDVVSYAWQTDMYLPK